LAFRDAAESIPDCYWTFKSDDDSRILLFSAENLLEMQEFITVKRNINKFIIYECNSGDKCID
jgi:hypothetical protein